MPSTEGRLRRQNGTRVGPTGDQELQVAQCLEGGQADTRAWAQPLQGDEGVQGDGLGQAREPLLGRFGLHPQANRGRQSRTAQGEP
jgi:hypothetical protein